LIEKRKAIKIKTREEKNKKWKEINKKQMDIGQSIED